ncbi:hypothetical protein NXU83_14085 [Bacteroides thetaiotaomicron]|uniref:hypothetical protein n=1 Tax=Bacteroides thetaiotaomicron TaxID=818 RepID=UPI002166B029|nr:hypothetical protein [Bacteroides thetaiotaomicron]MCS3182653.1 hypothetical protein [Bacteroides thetaiotaomicron]
MKLYDTTTRCNFESYVGIDINSLELAKYVQVLPAIGELGDMLGVTHDEYFVACSELDLQNDQLFDIEYFNPKGYHCGVLIMDNAAVRREFDKYGTVYYTNYSAYVVSAQYIGEAESKLVRYFLEKRYPEIFLHPEFTAERTVELQVMDMTLAQIIAEYGDMTFREARYDLPITTKKKYVVRESKFKIYPISYHRKGYEVYLKVNEEGDSLYIPVEAIIQKKYALVKNRQISYFTNYYKDKPDKLKTALKLLRSPEAKLLKELLSQNKKSIITN